jgi:hypothetical protein
LLLLSLLGVGALMRAQRLSQVRPQQPA